MKLAKLGAALCALGMLVSVVGMVFRAAGGEQLSRVAQLTAGFPWTLGLVLLMVAAGRWAYTRLRSTDQ